MSSSKRTDNTSAANALVQQVNKLSSVWVIPLLALVIGAWMIFDNWREQGPLVRIAFATAQGIKVNESLVKLRDIPIGKVVDIRLNKRLDGVILSARLNKNAESLLHTDTQFWVVKPRIGFGSISGLSTILSGSFIELTPGKAEETGHDFIGLENPPLTPAGTPGLHVTLVSSSDHAFDIGDPVLFRGSKVGRIEYVQFNTQERKTYYNAFIDAPYDKLLTSNTRFWEVKGVDVDVSVDGIKVNSGTLETLINGGVAFDVPDYLPKGQVITERAYFTIYPNKQKVNERIFNAHLNYVLLFKQSIRGLKPGSAVEYKGIKVGEVVRTDIDYPEMRDFLSQQTLLPVMIQIAPGRLGLQDDAVGLDKAQRDIANWILQGLHGVMAIDNMLTGSKYVELKYFPEHRDQQQSYGDVLMMPTADSDVEQLFSRVGHIVNTLDNLPLTALVGDARAALQNIAAAMQQLDGSADAFTRLLQQPQTLATLSQLNKTLQRFESLAASYSAGSETNQQLDRVLHSLDNAVKTLNPLLLQLKMQPSSVLFPGAQRPEPEPLGKSHE